jgi:adhesin/invasin
MQRILTPAAVLLFGIVVNAQTLPTVPIYNSIPAPLPPVLSVSQSFEALPYHYKEFGNQVAFSGTNRHLTSVTVAMTTLGYLSKYPSYPASPTGWTEDITLNLYSVDSSSPPKPASVIASVHQSFLIPWRPEPDPANCGAGTTMWHAPDGCHNGMSFVISFDFSGLSLTLPDQLIFGIAYNTQNAGYAPIGSVGPYNDLNVGLNSPATTGQNLSAPSAYLNSPNPPAYQDNGAAGVNVFRYDTGGTHTTIAIQFNVPAPPPASITVTGGGTQNATVGTQFANPLQATVLDAGGNPSAGVTMTFSVPSSGPSATLAATLVTTDSSGVASVRATANTLAGGPYPVTAGVTGVTAPATFNLINLTGPVSAISFVQQPANALAGQPLNPVAVGLKDAYNNPIAGTSITLSLQGGTATLNGTVTQTTASNGIATFPGLSVNTTGTYTLLATPTGGPSATSSAFTISPDTGSAAISVVDGNGQSATVNTAYGKPLKALVQDRYQNVFVNAPVTFIAPASGATVTFSGSATVNTDSGGIATAPSMTAGAQAGSVQVTASAISTPSPALFNLLNLAGAANRLSFGQQPTDTVASQDITPPPTVQLQDSAGNPVRTGGVPVTVQANAVLRLSGNATVSTDSTGLATFSNLSIALAGHYQLLASSSGTASATSNPFNVTTGAPSSITATGGAQQSALVLTTFPSPLQVTVADAAGNPTQGVAVAFVAPASGPGGTFGGLATFTAYTDAQGHAQAVITANNIAGAYLVTATSTLVTGSASFSLTNLPLASTVLSFVQQPSNTQSGQAIAPPVAVQVQNSSGGASNTAGVPIALSLSSGTGALGGTLVQVTDSTGTARFNDLRINTAGTKQLTATSQSQPSAVSNAFQIVAGTPATVTATSGTPQATLVSTPFLLLLAARAVDIAGNPVGGASVTFTVPASGPSGTFSGPASATTDINGNAVAPPLTANSTAGSFAVTASVAGAVSPAVFLLTNLPQAGSLSATPSQLSFFSQVNQPAPPGQKVQVTSTGAALTWTVSTSAPWITVSPTSGTTPGTATISVNPAGLPAGYQSGSAVFTSSNGGSAAVLIAYTIAPNPAFVITPSTLVFTTPATTITPPAQTLTATSTAGTIRYGVTSQVSTPSGGSWLKVAPGSGQTAGSVQVSVDLTGLGKGIYSGTVLFTAADSSINPVAVPVSLLVACGQGGCGGLPATILSVVNSASFHPGGAPRAAMTIFGNNLSDGVYEATTFPLPTRLGPTIVTVNGNAVPLFYVSPGQVNFQMPSGAPPTSVQVGVSNGFTRARTAPDQTVTLAVVDPGLFTSGGNRAAALNGDLTLHTASTPQPAGAFIVLYTTGGGPISPPLPDGTPAPSSPLSLLTGNVQVFIGGKPAQVQYAGAAPGLAGLSQINAVIPPGLAPGDQPVFISVDGVASNAGLITVK